MSYQQVLKENLEYCIKKWWNHDTELIDDYNQLLKQKYSVEIDNIDLNNKLVAITKKSKKKNAKIKKLTKENKILKKENQELNNATIQLMEAQKNITKLTKEKNKLQNELDLILIQYKNKYNAQ